MKRTTSGHLARGQVNCFLTGESSAAPQCASDDPITYDAGKAIRLATKTAAYWGTRHFIAMDRAFY